MEPQSIKAFRLLPPPVAKQVQANCNQATWLVVNPRIKLTECVA